MSKMDSLTVRDQTSMLVRVCSPSVLGRAALTALSVPSFSEVRVRKQQRNQAFVDLMDAAGVGTREFSELLAEMGDGCGATTTTERTISRWRMGDCAPPAAVVALLRMLPTPQSVVDSAA